MTEDTFATVVGIGELSRRTGVSVRTIRFYCDSGVLESRRTSGGHRTFDAPTAVERLLLVRRLRVLGLSLTAIVRVLGGTESIGVAVAAERTAVEAELDALRWRRASLLAIENATPAELSARLELLAAVRDQRAVLDALVAFWRPIIGALPRELFDSFVDMNAPPLPETADPGQVVAYAELAALATDTRVEKAMTQQIWRSNRDRVADRRQFVTALAEACEVAAPLVLAGESPCAGAVLDQYVHAHAVARRADDTPRFRRELLAGATETDPLLRRYWRLTADITGTEATTGAIHYWLLDALRCSIQTEQRAR